MKIISVNIGKQQTFQWKGKTVSTGIFKTSKNTNLQLSKTKVSGDEISDTKHHGGYYKACYIFSKEQYIFWRKLYPALKLDWGMFGENLTVENFDETQVLVGSTYRVGEALVKVSLHREPCYKLGYKFGDQNIISQFIKNGYSGAYLSVLEEGKVKSGDSFKLIDTPADSLTISQLFQLNYAIKKDPELLKVAVSIDAIPKKKRLWFESFIQ
jgi:MOSC domain-containing protein YiiM